MLLPVSLNFSMYETSSANAMESQANLSSAALAFFPCALDLCLVNGAVKHYLWYTASVATVWDASIQT